MKLFEINNLPYGKLRREYFLGYIREHGCIYVNKQWQMQTKDPDLTYLLKKGKIKLTRERGGYNYRIIFLKRPGSNQSKLILT